jgi:diguanylate cyclase (GGDEF)-like protein
MSRTDDAAARAPKNGDPAGIPASEARDRRQADERTLQDEDQTTADADQTVSDLDQTSSDGDQGLADRDQHQADVDQDASDRDQAASDRELAAHPDDSGSQRDHDASRDERRGSTIARTNAAFARAEIAAERLDQATNRDHDAVLRDLTARARDVAADGLDRAAADRARRNEDVVEPRYQRLYRAQKEYQHAVGETAGQARARAAADRAQAAKDRERAALDRDQAARDREDAQIALERAHLDDLTGAYQRGIGLVAIQHEIERATRGDGRLVLAFVDVDGLKAVNDRSGHAAGDRLLEAVGRALRARMRSYEPIVRYGGDEFLCALACLDVDAAKERFAEIRSDLDSGEAAATISVGLADLEPGDSVDDLIERADRELRAAREPSVRH